MMSNIREFKSFGVNGHNMDSTISQKAKRTKTYENVPRAGWVIRTNYNALDQARNNDFIFNGPVLLNDCIVVDGRILNNMVFVIINSVVTLVSELSEYYKTVEKATDESVIPLNKANIGSFVYFSDGNREYYHGRYKSVSQNDEHQTVLRTTKHRVTEHTTKTHKIINKESKARIPVRIDNSAVEKEQVNVLTSSYEFLVHHQAKMKKITKEFDTFDELEQFMTRDDVYMSLRSHYLTLSKDFVHRMFLSPESFSAEIKDGSHVYITSPSVSKVPDSGYYNRHSYSQYYNGSVVNFNELFQMIRSRYYSFNSVIQTDFDFAALTERGVSGIMKDDIVKYKVYINEITFPDGSSIWIL